MPDPQIVILGAGYTGARVAQLLHQQPHRDILVTHRDTLDVLRPDTVQAFAARVQPGAVVLHSIPVPKHPTQGHIRPTPVLAPILRKAARAVYLSTTGVYGGHHLVDENTPPDPRTDRESLRLLEEQDVAALCPSTLILRPAAIYGPGRGVHVSLQQGTHKLWGDGNNYISRIHVDDLARIAAAALDSPLTGAFPVADLHPCPAREITRFCAELLHIPEPAPLGHLPPSDTRSANRRVDGSAIRRLLEIDLLYPTYREGVTAAINSPHPPQTHVVSTD